MESKSPKEIQVEEKITDLVTKIVDGQTSGDDLPIRLWNSLRNNQEIAAIQEYANMVSIGRLGLNDHGPVHMKTVCRNALKMLSILHTAGIQTSLEKENIGTFADSVAAVMLASLLHDSGMTIGRKGHELYSGIISYSIIEKVLSQLLPEDCNILRRTIIRSIAIEGIIGHMATHPIHSVEAGIILIADGCDMTKGQTCGKASRKIPFRPCPTPFRQKAPTPLPASIRRMSASRQARFGTSNQGNAR